MEKQMVDDDADLLQSSSKRGVSLDGLFILGAFVFIASLMPIAYAADGFNSLWILVFIIFGVPVILFVIFLIFSYKCTRYSTGTIGRRVLRSLFYTAGLTVINLLIGAVLCTIMHGYNLKSCIDSCSEYTVTEGAITYFTFSQTYLAGAYLGTIIGAIKERKNRTA